MKKSSLVLLASLIQTLGWGVPSAVPPPERLKQNLQVLDANIKDLKENLTITKENGKTIEAELKDLEKFKADSEGLKKTYETYLERALASTQKNQKILEELEPRVQSLTSLGEGATEDARVPTHKAKSRTG